MTQQSRPVIGINMDVVSASKVNRPHLRLNQGYWESVHTSGGMPVLMPPFAKEAEIATFLDQVQGFVLSGGHDIDPRRFGLPMHRSIQPLAEKRDLCDRMLIRLLIERKIPVLAIGVGMLQLNLALGGSLIVHLPEEMPRSMPHMDPTNPGPHRHAVRLVAGSRLEEIYGENEILVNSNHHQAIKGVSPQFRIVANAPDGVIEAVEATDPNWFCLGVQWHPESESASALDLQLFECFMKACVPQEQEAALAA